jgi:rubrerythrin
VELAIEIEKNSRDFYYALIKKSKLSKAQEIFQYLALEESRHILAFKDILGAVQRHLPASYAAEYLNYMSALSGGYIFTQRNTGEAIVLKVQSDLQGIEIGISFEKDSITFYEGMKKAVPNN